VLRLFEVNSEPHTGARPSVRLCVGLIKLRKRDRKSTHFLELNVHPALKGANAILMGHEEGGVAGA